MSNFQKSKSIGGLGERLVMNYFTLAGIDCEKNSDFSLKEDYDLKCKLGRKKFTVEVKLDWLSSKTNNLAIETHNSKTGKESGINRTKADLWAVVIKDNENWVVFITSTNQLREYVKKNEGRKFQSAGDGNADLLLYSVSDILKIFKRIDNVCKVSTEKIDYTGIQKIVKGFLNADY